MQFKSLVTVAIASLAVASPIAIPIPEADALALPEPLAQAEAITFSNDRRPKGVPGKGALGILTNGTNPLYYLFNLAYKAVKETGEGVLKIATLDPLVELPELRIEN
ncbi:hypothetical protein DIURU_003709 [Diutina rugosa]|uniref:Uncharacterized protein n=1 Tax=Diutina rugosa TaxID=5481 RepID=A0A642UK75_DIURU|nr:uncharacterized protein DIURU_003709 [Diutina rugosa]KAA8900597.1 hypothetical protein DIURU_003709 [Diutina rugosa]